jgi:hypothetical protein
MYCRGIGVRACCRGRGQYERMMGMKRMVKVHRMEGMKGLGEDGGWGDER